MTCKRKIGNGETCTLEAGASGFCAGHEAELCWSCKGVIATCECSVKTTPNLTCGIPLCDTCVCPTHKVKGT
jgi:hypothetical protein